jgi:hypothetical protein
MGILGTVTAFGASGVVLASGKERASAQLEVGLRRKRVQ